jgi:excisionase family DNA binding protein
MIKQPATPEEIAAILARPTMSVDEFGLVMGIGRNQAYAAVREGRIRSLRLGKRVLIPTSAVLEMLGMRSESEE